MNATTFRHAAKRLLDIALCAASLPIAIPLATLIALVVKLSSEGPILFRANRVGRDMEQIQILKFRTMVTDSAGSSITRSGDPRITRIGRLLRASKLDELPQILNVLKGDMSLVGPRPEDPKFVAGYSEQQRNVLSMRPGITSLGSLRFRHEQELIERAGPVDPEIYYLSEILPEKLDIELEYIRGWTMRRDMRILACTVRGLLCSSSIDRHTAGIANDEVSGARTSQTSVGRA